MALYKKDGSYLLEEDEQGILDYIEQQCGKDFTRYVKDLQDEIEILNDELYLATSEELEGEM